MSLPIVDPRLAANSYADDPTTKKLQIEAVRKSTAGNVDKNKKLRDACEGFEAVFLQKLWEQMRHNVPKEGYLHSKDEETYQSMFDVELSKKMASAGGIGLADMMYEQLNVKLGEASRATSTSMLMKDHKIKDLHTEKEAMPLKANYGKLKVEGDPFAEQMGKKVPSRPVQGTSGTPNELSAGLYEDIKEDNLEGISKDTPSLDMPLKDVPTAANMHNENSTPQRAAKNLIMSHAKNSADHQSDVLKWAQGASGNHTNNSSTEASGAAAMLTTPFNQHNTGQAKAGNFSENSFSAQFARQGSAAGEADNANAIAESLALSGAAKATEIADGAEPSATAPKEIMMEIPGFKGMKRPFMQPFSKPASNLTAFNKAETVAPYHRPDPTVQSAEQVSTLRTPPVTTGLAKSPGRSSGQASVLVPPSQNLPVGEQKLNERDLGSRGANFGRSMSNGNSMGAGSNAASGSATISGASSSASTHSSSGSSGATGNSNGANAITSGMFPTFNEVPNI